MLALLVESNLNLILVLINPTRGYYVMIGANSITKNIVIPNKEDLKNSFEFVIQANKNLGIVDIQPRVPGILDEFQGRQLNDESTVIHLCNVLNEMLND